MIIDILLLMSIGYGAFLGYSKGIVQTLFNFVGYLFGAMFAVKFAPTVTEFLQTVLGTTNPMMYVVGIIVAFLVAFMFIRSLSKGIEALFQAAHISNVNSLFGAIFVGGISMVVYSYLLSFSVSSGAVGELAQQQSITYPFLKNVPPSTTQAMGRFKPIFHDFWDNSMNTLDKLQDVSVKKKESNPNIYDSEETKEDKTR